MKMFGDTMDMGDDMEDNIFQKPSIGSKKTNNTSQSATGADFQALFTPSTTNAGGINFLSKFPIGKSNGVSKGSVQEKSFASDSRKTNVGEGIFDFGKTDQLEKKTVEGTAKQDNIATTNVVTASPTPLLAANLTPTAGTDDTIMVDQNEHPIDATVVAKLSINPRVTAPIAAKLDLKKQMTTKSPSPKLNVARTFCLY